MQPTVALKKRKEEKPPIATQEHRSRKKRKAITYDKRIYGTVDAAFRSTVRSLGEKLTICGKHFTAHGKLLCGTRLGKPAAS